MTNRAMEFGIRITADGRVAVTETRNVKQEVASVGPVAASSGKAASAALDNIGVSAKQTAAALRNVPAQFTDIVTQLAAGQNPMQVFIQQGGQLKDMFGGAGPAASALGRYVAGLVNPLTLAAGAIGVLSAAYYQGSREADEYRRAIVMSGNAAGVTVDEMGDMARAISGVVGTQGKAAEALTAMAAGGRVAGDNLQQFSAVAIRLERTVAQPIEKTVGHLGELGKAPVEASLKLNEQYNYLTASVYAQIKALEDEGRTTEAAVAAQKAYAEALAQRTGEIEANLGYIEALWKGVSDTAKGAWDQMLGIGRSQSIAERIAELEQLTAPGRGIFAGRSAEEDAELARLKKKVADEKKVTAEKVAQQAADKASIALAQEADKYLDRELKKRNEIKRVEQLFNDSQRVKDPKREEKDKEARKAALAGIEAKYTDKSSVTEAAQLARAQWENRLKVVAAGVEHERALLAQAHAAGLTSEYEYNEAVYQATVKALGKRAALLQEKLGTAKTASEREAIAGELQAVQAEAIKAGDAYVLSRTKMTAADEAFFKMQAKESAALDDRIKKAEVELEAIGQAAEMKDFLAAQASVAAAAQHEEAAAAYEAGRAYAELTGNRTGVAFYERARDAALAQADALRKLGSIETAQGIKRAHVKAVDEATREWDRAFDQAGQSLSDEIVRGGKTGGELVESYFKTLVLRPTIQGGINLGVSAAGQALGLTGGGSSAAGLFNLGSAVNTASNFLGFGGFGSGVMSGISETLMGSSFVGPSASLAGGATGFGASVGAALPYVGAAVAALALLSGGGGGPKTELYGGDAGKGSRSSAIDDVVAGVKGAYADILKEFGAASARALKVSIGGDSDPSGDAPDAWGYRVWWDGDTQKQKLGTSQTFGRGAGVKNVGLLADRALLEALKATDINGVVNEYLDTLNVGKLKADSAAAAIATVKSLDGILDAFKQIGVEADEVDMKLVNAMGGVSNAAASLAAFRDAYYTDAEKQAWAQEELSAAFEDMGRTLPTTTEEMRDMIEAVQAAGFATDEQKTTYAKLLALAIPTKQYIDSLNATADATLSATQATNEKAAADEQHAIDLARADVSTAYEREADALRGLKQRMGDFATSIASFRSNLALSAFSPLSPKGRLDEAAAAWDAIDKKARLGDEEALAAFNQASQQYIELAYAYYGTNEGFQEIYNKVVAASEAAEDTASRQASLAEQQLDTLKQSVAGILDVNESIKTLADAIEKYTSVKATSDAAALARATAGTSTSTTSTTTAGSSTGSTTTTTQAGSGTTTAANDASYTNATALKTLYDASKAGGLSKTEIDALVAKAKGLGLTPQQAAQAGVLTKGWWETKLRSYDVGTARVPYDMTAQIHRDEIIVDPRSSEVLRRYGIQVQSSGSAASTETAAALRAQTTALERQNTLLTQILGRLETNQQSAALDTRSLKQHLAHVLSKKAA